MNNKDDIIAQGALTQFAKFGLRKTTMQDVADEASISRQTLYNRVPNKDALLRLVAKYYFDKYETFIYTSVCFLSTRDNDGGCLLSLLA